MRNLSGTIGASREKLLGGGLGAIRTHVAVVVCLAVAAIANSAALCLGIHFGDGIGVHISCDIAVLRAVT